MLKQEGYVLQIKVARYFKKIFFILNFVKIKHNDYFI